MVRIETRYIERRFAAYVNERTDQTARTPVVFVDAPDLFNKIVPTNRAEKSTERAGPRCLHSTSVILRERPQQLFDLASASIASSSSSAYFRGCSHVYARVSLLERIDFQERFPERKGWLVLGQSYLPLKKIETSVCVFVNFWTDIHDRRGSVSGFVPRDARGDRPEASLYVIRAASTLTRPTCACACAHRCTRACVQIRITCTRSDKSVG